MRFTFSILMAVVLVPAVLAGAVQAKEVDRLDTAVQLIGPGPLVAGQSDAPDHDDEHSDDDADTSGQTPSDGNQG